MSPTTFLVRRQNYRKKKKTHKENDENKGWRQV